MLLRKYGVWNVASADAGISTLFTPGLETVVLFDARNVVTAVNG